MNPTVSLIIPAYNEEKYIGACLKCVTENTAGKFLEIIVIDNASVDKTSAIAQQFPGVRVIREAKQGLAYARQRGFLEAKGEILAYIDADTCMRAGWLETITKEFSSDSKLVCLSGPYIYYDLPRFQQFLVKLFWWLALPIYWLTRYMVIAGNFAIRRNILQQMGGFDLRIAFYGDDTDIARRAHQLGKVKFKLGLVMPTSGRRLAGQGFWKTGFLYVYNFFAEVFIHRPVTKEHQDIR